jgi:hypothetical protein
MAMGATVHPSLVSLIVRQLPRPLLSALDAWSHRVARRRAAERQRKWEQRKAGAGKPEAGIPYQLKPWRD